MKPLTIGRVLASKAAWAGFALTSAGLAIAAPPLLFSAAYAPNAKPLGLSQAEWSAKWWQWALELPVTDHPFTPTPSFDVTDGQSGKVWFLAAPFADPGDPNSTERTCTIPAGKSLFVALLTVEASSLEAPPFFGATAEEQAAAAQAIIDDFVVVDSLFCEVDGVPVPNLADRRYLSPQYTLTAPTPWIFGDVGGTGTSVGDGYYVFLKRLEPGPHVLHFGGTFDFGGGATATIDMTYNLTQLGDPEDGD